MNAKTCKELRRIARQQTDNVGVRYHKGVAGNTIAHPASAHGAYRSIKRVVRRTAREVPASPDRNAAVPTAQPSGSRAFKGFWRPDWRKGEPITRLGKVLGPACVVFTQQGAQAAARFVGSTAKLQSMWPDMVRRIEYWERSAKRQAAQMPLLREAA